MGNVISSFLLFLSVCCHYLSVFISLLLELLIIEFFIYWSFQFFINFISPACNILLGLVRPASNMTISSQVSILEKDFQESGREPKEENGLTTFRVNTGTLRKLSRDRWKRIVLVNIALVTIYYPFITVSPLIGGILFAFMVLCVSIAILPGLEFFGFEFKVLRSKSTIPLLFHVLFFVILTVSTFCYYFEGVNEFVSLLYGSVWSVIYYKTTNIAFNINSEPVGVIVTCPRWAGIE
ncbi:MAG: hypothetical protein ACFFD4_38090 [Candidatus Odinarchaeota archaeon]